MTEAIKQWIADNSAGGSHPLEYSWGLTKGIEIAAGFTEWYPSEGWQNYDGHDRWINPSEGNSVLTTSQLLEKYLETLNKEKA